MIKEITNPQVWNDFILRQNPNTFLQTWEWGQVQHKSGSPIKYLAIYQNEKQVGAALTILVPAKRGQHYLIPHGPLLQDTANHDICFVELIDHLKQQARAERACAIRIAPLMLVNDNALAFFHHHHFRPAPLHVHAELTWVLDITPPPETILSGMRKTTRHAIRRAERAGITTEIIVEPTHAIERFWPLYEQTQQRHGFVVWSRKVIQYQLEEFSATNRIFTIVARYNNKDVAAAILPHVGSTTFYYHGASVKMPSSVPATQYLQWQAMHEAKKRGATRYNFWGIAPDDTPNHPFAGITIFKKGFGGYAQNYLHAQDYPLSWKYLGLWGIDSWRKIRRGF